MLPSDMSLPQFEPLSISICRVSEFLAVLNTDKDTWSNYGKSNDEMRTYFWKDYNQSWTG